MRSTKKTLVMSVLSMVICIAMLAGTTFAWFTDTASTGVNKIQAGNLDVTLEYYNNGEWKDATNVGTLFSTTLWEPGHTEVVFLKVSNVGSLALNYLLNVTPVNENGGINVAGEAFKLSDYLVFKTVKIDEADIATYTRDIAVGAAGTVQGLNQEDLAKSENLLPEANAVYALVVYMPNSVGNAANHKAGTAAPYIELGVTLVAKQMAHEEDSFGKTYDENADYSPDNVGLDQIEYFFHPQVSETLTGTAVNGVYTFVTEQEYVNNIPVATIKVPEGRLEDSAKPIEFSVTATTLPTGIYVADDKQSFSYEITVGGLNDAATNTGLVYMELKVPEGLINATVYHYSTPMTKAASAAAVASATEECFFYADGTLYLKTKSFSPYTIVANKATDISVLSADELQAAIDAADKGETLVLGASVLVTEDTTIDLKGRNLTFTSHAKEAFRVKAGTLTINGNGTVDGSATQNGIAVWVIHGKAVINGGNYIGGEGCSCIYAYDNADVVVEINGGHFEVKAPWNGFYYVLNQRNNPTTPGKITVNGGTFVNYDPSKGDDNLKGNFVGSGCIVESNDETYTVVKKFASGTGTEADPYMIETTEQLKSAGEISLSGKHFALKNDVVAPAASDYSDLWGYPRKASVCRLISATFDGRNYKITADKDNYLFGDIRNTTIKNLKVELNGVPMTYFAMSCTFDTVTTLGKATFGNNSAAFLVYPYYDMTMRNCVNEADLRAGGAWNNYNAVFVGYGSLSNGYTYTFENCVNKGTLIGGTSSMFIGNVSYGSPNVVINHCRNEGTIQATYQGEKSYEFNMFVSVTNDGIYTLAKYTFNGESKTPSEMIEMSFDALGGTWIQGPHDEDLKLTLDENNKFVITPSQNMNVATYTISIGVYGKIVKGGSRLQMITIEVPASKIESLDVKKLAFVDDTWVAAHPNAVKTEHAAGEDLSKAYVTYELDGVTYYLYDCQEGFATLDGNTKMATEFALSAYDAAGNLIASTGLSD